MTITLDPIALALVMPNSEFTDGVGNWSTYDNGSGRLRLELGVGSPHNVGNRFLRVSYDPARSMTPINPGYGGVKQPISPGTVASSSRRLYRSGSKIRQVIIARIPVGRRLVTTQNSLGDGFTSTWLSSQEGTGEWAQYVHEYQTTRAGAPADFGYLYVDGGPDTAFTWDVSSYYAVEDNGPTVQNLGVYGTSIGTSTIDIQYSTDRDFQFAVSPLINVPWNPDSVATLWGINQSTTYFVRGRERFADGRVDEWGPTLAFTTPAAVPRAVAPAAVMIEPAIIVRPAAITRFVTRNTLPGFPPENLLRADLTAFRARITSTQRWVIDFEVGGAPVDVIALLNTNLPEDATWFFQAGAVAINDNIANVQWSTTSAPCRASIDLPGRSGYHALARFPAPQQYRWWRIVIDANLFGDVLQAQHLVAGLNRASRNHSVEKVEQPSPMTTIDRKRSGILDRVRGIPMRKVEFELSMLTEAQYETIYSDLWRYENDPFLIVPNSKRGAFLHDRILYGELSGGRTVNPTSPRYTRQFAVTSII